MRHRYVVRFAIDGDLRFISHHDTVRLFERALARAEWPVRFSEGFNPRPRLSLPLPRGVGIASDDELLVVELTEAVDPDEALERLRAQMPAGIRLHGLVVAVFSGVPAPCRVWYEARLPAVPADLDEAIERLRQRTSVVVTRTIQGETAGRDVDIRPFLFDVSRHEDRLRIGLIVTPEGTARPAEVLAALGLSAIVSPHRLRRTRVEWTNLDAPPAASPPES